ncbi:dTDP-4-dehydrorhamnose 3,5-epimerase [Cardinium endosymbiont of Tipula unca]|uniref:dTDP-4-dehydrorhamnose 3,5-epimerase n=1 Tax=Cardinium endosymbiont of Tipula unca TaxID=3066216 RepID=UPI0030CA6E34
MKLEKQPFSGLLLIKPTTYYDTRGYFLESYHKEKFNELGLDIAFIQENQSLSKKGTVRGLHYQLEPYAQSKLVHVVHGAIWDVVVDLRKEMGTFGQWQGFLLSSENHYRLFIPKGFAHGFVALHQDTVVCYQCDMCYQPSAEQGIYFQDPTLNIPWEQYITPSIISEKDAKLPLFKQAIHNF